MMMKDYIVPCSCHSFHFLRFTSWPEDDKNPDYFLAETYMSIGGDFWHSWKDRIRGAWHVLSGRHAHSCEVLLDREGAVKLRNILEGHLHVIGYELPPNPPRPAFPPRQDDMTVCFFDGSEFTGDVCPVCSANEAAAEQGLYDVPAMVCVTHKRFVPCRKTDGACVFSCRDDDIEEVRVYQTGELYFPLTSDILWVCQLSSQIMLHGETGSVTPPRQPGN